MAKRIVCCPGSGDGFEYLYVDTSCLLVENITDKVSVLVSDAGSRCCFDALAGYSAGEKVLSEQEQDLFDFDFFGIHSFELFKDKEELRLKTGSDKILHSCLLNYYRREYDGTQQHTFFAEPTVGNTYVRVSGGVEHELTLESREWVKNQGEDEVELETLDKGKSLAEREAEAEKAQAELAEQEALADAEAKAEKAEKKDKARKKHQRMMEEERYREFRNQDNVQAEEYRRFRQYEEEMRQNNASLTSEYNRENYASLPGYIAPAEFAGTYENHSNETLSVAIDDANLYRLASRFDEFEVPYTVIKEERTDGYQLFQVMFSSDYADRATSASEFFELERSLYTDEIVSGQTYYNAFQLSALEYAYENNIDAHYVANGDYNGNQMFRILDAGLNGYDMATLANPGYTPAHMDALCYYMSCGWDTKPISDPSLAPIDVADRVMQEEYKNGVPRENTFFFTHDYNGFLAYQPMAEGSPFFNDYDSAQVQKFYAQQGQRAAAAEARENFAAYKDNLHAGYIQRQAEMHYIGHGPETLPLMPDVGVPTSAGIPATAGNLIPHNVLNDNPAFVGAGQSRYTINGYVRSDSSFAPYTGARSAAVLQGLANSSHAKASSGDRGGGNKAEVVSKHGAQPEATSGDKRTSDLKVRYKNGAADAHSGFDDGPRSGSPARMPVSNKMPGMKHRPLDDLKVRSDFARRNGLKLQTYGNKCVSVGIGSVRNAFHKVTNTVSRNDETGAVSAYHSVKRVAGNTVLVAQLVGDVPRQVARAGQGISYAGNAIKNLDRKFWGDKPVDLKQKTISSKQVHKDYVALQNKQFHEIRKKYGSDAAKMNVREINRNIKRLDGKKNALIKENQTLKKEIRALYDKKGLSKAERALLKDKLALKKKNDALIKKHFSDIKKLNELKTLKKGDGKALEALKKQQKKFGLKEGRWGRAGGALLQGFVSKMHQAGADNTMGGMATASSFVMGYVRSPIRRVVGGAVNLLVVRPVKFVAKKAIIQPTAKVVKKVVLNSKVYRNAKDKHVMRVQKRKTKQINRINQRNALKKKVETKINNRLEKTFGKKAVNGAKKIWRGGKKAGSIAGRIISAPFKAIKMVTSAISNAFVAAKAFLMKILFGVIAAFLVLMMLSSIISAIVQLVTSIFPGSEDNATADGQINMTHYVEVFNECQNDLQSQINDIATGKSSTGEEYDNVYYDFNGVQGNNAAEIFSMAAVRFEWDLTSDATAVDDYIKQLYTDSNYFDYVESEPYFCDNGCEERTYKCFDKPDKYATETRKSLYNASDHSDEPGVGKGHEHGCVASKPYSCMTTGHGTYNKNGCLKHNNGKVMSSPCSCGNCKEVITEENETEYYCQGYCSGKHVDYSCPGHTEQVCYGKHINITFTITSLGFDDIFNVDTFAIAEGALIRGDAYENKFVISAYCSCHECCHPYDPACTGKPSKTASGTTPKANYTLAVDKDNPAVPLGTHVWIDGKEYVVEDTGALAAKDRDFDMYFDSHEEALKWGVRTKTVYQGKNKEASGSPAAGAAFEGWTEENRELAQNIHQSFAKEVAAEIYIGLDKVVDTSYGIPMDTEYDFSGIVFDDVTGLTNRQQQVLKAINSHSIATVKGRCQAWVADVYQVALGGSRVSKCCANHAGEAWGVSKDWSKIQVGATVYGYSSSKYGHVGIYIGNGQVAHNIGYVKVQSLESWLNTYNGQCWGWNGGMNLTGKSAYNCKAAGTFMHGKD